MNYQDWKRENPTKSINDYYLAFPEKKYQHTTTSTPITSPVIIHQNKKTKAAKPPTDILLILSSILIIVAFFLPWVNINVLNINFVNSSGADLPDILKLVYNDSPQIDRFANAVYLIPIGGIMVLIGEAGKIFSLKAIGEVLVFLLSCIWFYALYAMFNYAIQEFGLSVSITNFYTTGMYLTLAGSLYYFFDIVKGFFD